MSDRFVVEKNPSPQGFIWLVCDLADRGQICGRYNVKRQAKELADCLNQRWS